MGFETALDRFPPGRLFVSAALALLLLLPGFLAASEKKGTSSPADRFWAKAMKATELGRWDLARAMLAQFARKYSGDPRAEEARSRASGNAVLTYYCHDCCHLGGAALPEKGGIGASPHYCAVCREETVRAIYRYVNPVDDYAPREKTVTVADPLRRRVFSVVPMKPLDPSLTVVWKLDGEVQKKGIRREFFRRSRGKKTKRPVPFPVKPRKKQYFDPAKSSSQAGSRQVKAAFSNAPVAVREIFSLDTASLSPGEHTVEAVVTDETPWVLWDPENLLTETVTWTVVK